VARGPGKKWEDAIKRGLEKAGAYVYRLRDCPSAWGDDSLTKRFSVPNIADFIAFLYDTMFVIEAKTVQGRSLRWDSIPERRQKMMQHARQHDGVMAGVLVYFREDDMVVWIDIETWVTEQESSEKKSFNVGEAALFADDHVTKQKGKLDWEGWLRFWLRRPDDFTGAYRI
jgi:penicillin-binding protein-related factor A (putative recombinase)